MALEQFIHCKGTEVGYHREKICADPHWRAGYAGIVQQAAAAAAGLLLGSSNMWARASPCIFGRQPKEALVQPTGVDKATVHRRDDTGYPARLPLSYLIRSGGLGEPKSLHALLCLFLFRGRPLPPQQAQPGPSAGNIHWQRVMVSTASRAALC